MEKPITNTYKGRSGETYQFEYTESDSLKKIRNEKLTQVAVFAFHKGKLLIVNNTTKPGAYGPISGTIEDNETPEEAVIREVQEESNMKVLHLKLIGYQKCINKSRAVDDEYQLRYFAKVEPHGPFVLDSDGDVTEVIEIDPKDHRDYFVWGKTSGLIVNKAIELDFA